MRVVFVVTLSVAMAAPCAAQQARPADLSIETSAAVDTAVAPTGTPSTGTVVDTIVSVGLGRGFEAIARPWAQRLGTTKDWNPQVWLATLRYQRQGHVAVRVDGGLIPSPVGLATMELRPTINPTIGMPASLFTPLPSFEANMPRATLLGALYPYGVSATVSTTRWDARAAVIDTTPLRMRMVISDTNPPRFGNVVFGGGVTPVIGWRIGGSITRGGWQNAAEGVASADSATTGLPDTPPPAAQGYGATVLTVESQYAFRFTSIAGEWVRDRLETATRRTVAPSGWFIQGQQTLSPRWFAAGRIDHLSAPALVASGAYEEQRFNGAEEIIGYRLTPEVTIRGGHRAQRGFGRDAFSHTATVSIVWAKRWM